jgi:hypothetical protein
MAIVVTERWTGSGLSKPGDSYEGIRNFDVSGTYDSAEAIATLESEKDCATGRPYPGCPDPNVTSMGVEFVERPSPDFWVYRVRYAIPKGDWGTNPLASKVLWTPLQKMKETDRDADGQYIANMAGRPFDNKCTDEVSAWELAITRHELFFDIAKANAFKNRVNSVALVLGPLPIAVRQMLCIDVSPTAPYLFATTTFIEMQYRFLIDTSEAYPHDHHRMNLGREGYWDKSGTKTLGPFALDPGTDSDSRQRPPTFLTMDVPLDGDGKPIDTSIKIAVPKAGSDLFDFKTVVAPPNKPTPLATIAISNGTNTMAWDLVFKAKLTANFVSLGLW